MPVRITSIKTYKDIINEGLLGEQEEIVFTYFFENPGSTDRECSEVTKLKINAVTGRRNELVNCGCLVEDDKRHCNVSGRLSLTWCTPDKIKFNVNVMKRNKCEFCGGKGYFLQKI